MNPLEIFDFVLCEIVVATVVLALPLALLILAVGVVVAKIIDAIKG